MDEVKTMDEVKAMLADLRGEGETVTCSRCGKEVAVADAEPEEGGEWECPPCWERCETQERSDQARAILDEMCNQRRLHEIPGQEYLHASFEDAYDELVTKARQVRRLLNWKPQKHP